MSQLQDNLEEILRQKNTYLLPANLKKDVSLLGVTGTLEALDTSDADATSNDIVNGATAYVNGEKITGAMVEQSTIIMTFTDSDVDYFSLDTGGGIEYEGEYETFNTTYYINNPGVQFSIGASIIADLYNIVSNKLMPGVDIAGIIGTATTDANATASDIAQGKTAYVNGVKLTGTAASGPISQAEYDEAVATLDDLLTGSYEDVYDVMRFMIQPEDDYAGVGGTPTQIENTIDTLLGVNN